MNFGILKINLSKRMSDEVVSLLEAYFSLEPPGRFRNRPLELFGELELQEKWGATNTSTFKKACNYLGYQQMVNLIEVYEQTAPKVAPQNISVQQPQISTSTQRIPTLNQNPVQTVEAPIVFISYCKTQESKVELIKKVLESNKMIVEYEQGYQGDINEFITKVRTTKIVLLLISKEYLEDETCMSAILELIKYDDYKKRMVLIIHDNAKISTPLESLYYIKYWSNRFEELNSATKTTSRESSGSYTEVLKKYRNINNEIGNFVSVVKNRVTIPLAELKNTKYSKIIEYINKLSGLKK